MAISGIDVLKMSAAAQQYGTMFQAGGAQMGATISQKPENVTGVGTESESASKFNWQNLNKFDGILNGVTSQAGLGKTSEIPSDTSIFSVGQGQTQSAFGGTQSTGNSSGLMATLNNLDAKDIGLNSNKNGMDGQRYINFLA